MARSQINCPDSLSRGRLTKVDDWAGEHLYKYDPRGQKTIERHVIDGTTYELDHFYDSLGRETSLRYPDGELLTGSFGAQGLTSQLSSSWAVSYLDGALHEPDGKPVYLGSGSGAQVVYSYRPTDLRLTSIVTGTLYDQTFDYDPKGNITTMGCTRSVHW